MEKVIEFEFEDGEKWHIPLEFVAKHRADYYQTKNEKDFDYHKEVSFVMNDDYEGEDWLKNNMDLADFEKVLIKIPAEIPPERDWCNADSTIKTI